MRAPTLLPAEFNACRAAFESLDSIGYRDMSYDRETRRYISGHTQSRWVQWQVAWREGQKYIKEGGKSSPAPEPVQEAPAAPRRVMRVGRTPQG